MLVRQPSGGIVLGALDFKSVKKLLVSRGLLGEKTNEGSTNRKRLPPAPLTLSDGNK